MKSMVLSVCAEKLLEPVAKFGFVAFARGADAFRSGEAWGASQGAQALELCVRTRAAVGSVPTLGLWPYKEPSVQSWAGWSLCSMCAKVHGVLCVASASGASQPPGAASISQYY